MKPYEKYNYALKILRNIDTSNQWIIADQINDQIRYLSQDLKYSRNLYKKKCQKKIIKK